MIFEYETFDLYSVNGEEPTSKLLEIEFEPRLVKGEVVIDTEYIWCVDSKQFLDRSGAPYELSLVDKAGIMGKAIRITEQPDNMGVLHEIQDNL